jgi:aldehyde dehydrogenase (NAD(P)+)
MIASPITVPSLATPVPSEARRIDESVGRLRESAARFTRLSLKQRIALARAMQVGYLGVAQESVMAACAAKGIPLGTPLEGEEWSLGPWFVVRHLPLIQESLSALERTGNTRLGRFGRTIDGRLSVQVYPANVDGAGQSSDRRVHALRRAARVLPSRRRLTPPGVTAR